MIHGARVQAKHDIERYPHFIVPAGSLGTVRIEHDGQAGKPSTYVRVDETIPGCEEWDNEVIYNAVDGDDAAQDWSVVPVGVGETR